jgi:hypothetical protein
MKHQVLHVQRGTLFMLQTIGLLTFIKMDNPKTKTAAYKAAVLHLFLFN